MEALAAAAISMVAPYLAKGAEEFAKGAGASAFEAVKSLAQRLRRWWSHESVAAAAAERMADDPKKYSPIVVSLLAAELDDNEDFAAEIQRLVHAVQPHIEVVQRMEVARGVTGADIDELVSGRVRVAQTMDEAQDVTAFKAKKVGR